MPSTIPPKTDSSKNALADYYRCPDQFNAVATSGSLSEDTGFFQFGPNVICYGQCAEHRPAKSIAADLPDVMESVKIDKDGVCLPFDLSQVANNLRFEYFIDSSNGKTDPSRKTTRRRRIYYLLRPVLPVSIRKHLQRLHFKGWQEIPFPHWPVDFSVDSLMERALSVVLRSGSSKRVPFIWFWPHGAPSCSIMTHDVEASAGRDMCGTLMDIDDSFGVKSAFQIVPELRYEAPHR